MGKVIYLQQHGVRPVDHSPISAMNITPLIDVMLVLLVILIITLPATLHEVDVPLPVPGPITGKEPVVQKLLLTSDGVAQWNGTALDDAALGDRLRATATAGDDLQFQADANARYERFHQLITLVRKSGVNNIGFVGNSQFAKWDKPVADELH
ncbi:MAG: biopolymer transporter ExbD [Sphingorhabdus sp.]